MQYAAWAFFLALVIIGVFIFAPKPEDAKKTEEEAPEIASRKCLAIVSLSFAPARGPGSVIR